MKLLTIVIAALSLVVVACGDEAATPTHSDDHSIPAARGSQLLLPLDELKEVSTLVVRGSPTASSTIQKALTGSSDYPEDLRALHSGQTLNINKITFSFVGRRILQGRGGFGNHHHGGHDRGLGRQLLLVTETSYVLYLFEPDSDEGKAYWQGYLVQGLQQGVWVVDGDTATRQVGEERTVPLSRFSEAESTPDK